MRREMKQKKIVSSLACNQDSLLSNESTEALFLCPPCFRKRDVTFMITPFHEPSSFYFERLSTTLLKGPSLVWLLAMQEIQWLFSACAC